LSGGRTLLLVVVIVISLAPPAHAWCVTRSPTTARRR
jgi:hypothetical protein